MERRAEDYTGDPEEGDDHSDFLRMYVGKTPQQFKNYWKSQVFTGRGKAPEAFTSPDELMNS